MFQNLRSYIPSVTPRYSHALKPKRLGKTTTRLHDDFLQCYHKGLDVDFTKDINDFLKSNKDLKIFHYAPKTDAICPWKKSVPINEQLPNLTGNLKKQQSDRQRHHTRYTKTWCTRQNSVSNSAGLNGHFIKFGELKSTELTYIKPIKISPLKYQNKLISKRRKIHRIKKKEKNTTDEQPYYLEFEAPIPVNICNEYRRYLMADKSHKLTDRQLQAIKPFSNIGTECGCKINMKRKDTQNNSHSCNKSAEKRLFYISLESKDGFDIIKTLKIMEDTYPSMMKEAVFLNKFPATSSPVIIEDNSIIISDEKSTLRTEETKTDTKESKKIRFSEETKYFESVEDHIQQNSDRQNRDTKRCCILS